MKWIIRIKSLAWEYHIDSKGTSVNLVICGINRTYAVLAVCALSSLYVCLCLCLCLVFVCVLVCVSVYDTYDWCTRVRLAPPRKSHVRSHVRSAATVRGHRHLPPLPPHHYTYIVQLQLVVMTMGHDQHFNSKFNSLYILRDTPLSSPHFYTWCTAFFLPPKISATRESCQASQLFLSSHISITWINIERKQCITVLVDVKIWGEEN